MLITLRVSSDGHNNLNEKGSGRDGTWRTSAYIKAASEADFENSKAHKPVDFVVVTGTPTSLVAEVTFPFYSTDGRASGKGAQVVTERETQFEELFNL